MALSTHDALSVNKRGRRRRGRRGALSEINVTPLVDVMLVLLIIFMVSAPLLTVGVPVELPKTDATAIDTQTEPVTVSIKRDGSVYLGDAEAPFAELATRVGAQVNGAADKPIFVRADGGAPYAAVAQVMARLSSSGFTKLSLITDTGDDSTQGAQRRAGAGAAAP